MKKIIFGALLLCGCIGGRFVRVARQVVPTATMINIPAVVTRLELSITPEGELTLRQSTVAVTISGSGVLISPNGHILTCAHLFGLPNEGAIKVTLSNGETAYAELLYKDENRDLALLKIEVRRPVPYARIATQRSLEVGQEVVAVGNPLRLPFSVTHGIISALGRDEEVLGVAGLTQSDCSINPGNSGGPLFNLSGELIGINSRILPPVDAPVFTGLGFSVSPRSIAEFLERYKGLAVVF